MKPIIGLIPLYDDEKDSYWMVPGYMKLLEQCGAFPIMLPLSTKDADLECCIRMCDGFLFTGGQDVDPTIYGELPKSYCASLCKERDIMEGYILDEALHRQIPVFGICRGLQFMNAHLGGSLYQDLEQEFHPKVEHHMSPPYDRKAHKVHILPESILASLIGEGTHEVNSYHHQAIKELAPELEAMALSEDGLIEAVCVKGQRFAMAVQWHPEFDYTVNEDSIKLMQAFVDACK